MDVIKEMVDNNYSNRRDELFNMLDKAIIDAIVEKKIVLEPVDVDSDRDKYRVNLVVTLKVSSVKIKR